VVNGEIHEGDGVKRFCPWGAKVVERIR